MQTVRRIQQLDLDILHSLYKYRILTVPQLRKLHFANSYTYRKLSILKNSGFVTTEPLLHRGRKATSLYRLTDRGICLLQEHGLITQTIKSSDLKIHPDRRTYHLQTNDILIDLSLAGWQVMDSRETKAKYRIDRGDLVQGCITNRDGQSWLVYLFLYDAEDVTVVKALNQIGTHNQNVAVFFRGQQSMDKFIEKQALLGVVTSGEMLLLPYEYGIHLLRTYQTSDDYLNLFRAYGEIRESDHPHFPYEIFIDEQWRCLVNLLGNDLMKVFELQRITEGRLRWRDIHAFIPERMEERYLEWLGGLRRLSMTPLDVNELKFTV
ncbi:MAG: hypothetical protein BAA01_03025 [Bacillus thermozeamaize]|uniref:Replication-relaxation n=1 Tax=Bacillus thermozeamaize TaxID=230954 RepID=A0A1Y3PFL9_9BACI|nr:MAG: hypothetical protein BAA01_03025 [Bacillus thermozeamaize]